MASEEVKDNCGVFVAHTLHDVYNGIKALQHRGQDTTGIATRKNDGTIDVVRWVGAVSDFSLESLSLIIPEGNLFIGHVRYSTMKGKDFNSIFQGAHPRVLGGKFIDYSKTTTTQTKFSQIIYPHNIVRDASKAIVHNGNIPAPDISEADLCNGKIDTDLMLEFYSREGIQNTLRRFIAAYSIAILDDHVNGAIVARDRYGIRPLWIGRKDGNIIASSEDVAIWEIGGKPLREVDAGEIIHIPLIGEEYKSQKVFNEKQRFCFFEGNYMQSASSSICGRSVSDIRRELGIQIAKEYTPEVDLISFIPHSPEFMARAYSEIRNIEFKPILYKVSKRRVFLESSQEEREKDAETNFFIRDNVDIKGKRILFLDDSLVKGINSKEVAIKLREKEVKWIGLALGTPVVGPKIEGIQRGCLYGVDMPPGDNFAIKRCGSIENIIKESHFDNIYFISMNGLSNAHKHSLEELCTYCIGGANPLS